MLTDRARSPSRASTPCSPRRARRVTASASRGAISLTAIGLGAIIGTGIFIVIGAGAAEAGGAAVIVSFAIAAFACAFSAMAYAELASSIPVAGSTFTYTYATMGEIIARLIGCGT
jgi:APA family basic amino acid/polyamine antiporter